MDYISQIFERATLQQICSFLMSGSECAFEAKSYRQRLREASDAIDTVIRENFPKVLEFESITDRIQNYIGESENVYMEIGLQCGLLLAAQILENLKK